MITLSSGNLYYSQKEVDEIKSNNKDLAAALKSDFYSVSIALRDEALDRDWCEMYNEFVDNVNTGLVHMKLLTLKANYQVKVKIEETREQYVYITVEATSEEEAEEIVDANWDYSDVLNQANDYDWEVTDYDTNTENATEV